MNKCLSRILNICWPEDLWERTQQCRIEESIKKRKWKWIGHTSRKPENNIMCSARVESSGVQKKRSPKAIPEAKCER